MRGRDPARRRASRPPPQGPLTPPPLRSADLSPKAEREASHRPSHRPRLPHPRPTFAQILRESSTSCGYPPGDRPKRGFAGAGCLKAPAPSPYLSGSKQEHCMHSKVIIIGSGPAGYTAAIYAARAMLEPVMINGIQPGGQLTITTDVENYPGFADVIQGPWLMEQMKAQAEHVGTRIVNDLIIEVDFDQRPFVLKGDSGTTYTADCVIIATGAQARWLGLPSEAEIPGLWRLRLRHLRRLLLSRTSTCSSSAAATPRSRKRCSSPISPRKVTRHPPPQRIPRRAHPAGPAVQAPQDRGALEHRARRHHRPADAALGHRRRAAQHHAPARPRPSPSTASSSPSATPRRPRCSPASST